MNVRSRWALYLLTFLLSAPAFGQRHSFAFDSDVEGWTFLSNNDVVWDDASGVPPGSLRVTRSIALSPCFSTTPEGDWSIGAVAFTEGLGCYITVEGHDASDCSDSVTGSPSISAETRLQNEWRELSFDYPLGFLGSHFRLQAYSLDADLPCYFDNVEAIGPLAPPSPVPTLDDTAMLVLAALIAAAGVLLVRRTRA